MKLSTLLLVMAFACGMPIMFDLATTEKMPVLFWCNGSAMVGLAALGLYFWATGDEKEI
ncbi:hypothetical protein MnBA_39930 [Marinobacterium sp. BA1]